MASIKKIENKKGVVFRITVSNGYDMQGKKIKQTATFTPDLSMTPKQQERAANKFALEFEEKVKTGGNFDGEKLSFEEFALKWLEDKKENIAYNTYVNYKGQIENYMIPFLRGFKLADIKIPHIENYYKSLVNDFSQSSIVKHASTINGIFKTAVRLDMLDKNPCAYAELPKSKNKIDSSIKFFTPEESLMFIKSLEITYPINFKEHDKRVGKDKKMVRIDSRTINSRRTPMQYKVFYNISLFCGLRKGEVLALKWPDIDFDSKTINVSKSAANSDSGQTLKEPKTKSSIRVVKIPENVLILLKAYKIEYNEYRLKLGTYWQGNGNLFIQDNGALMGTSTPYSFFTNHIKRYNKFVRANKEKASEKGLAEIPLIPLHGLRHSTATLLNHLGVNITDISSMLGHSRTSTTMDIYTHSFEKQSNEAVDKMNEFIQANA